jgi:hypothetical protein
LKMLQLKELSEREQRVRLKLNTIRTLKKEAAKFKAMYIQTGGEWYLSKLSRTVGKIEELSHELDYLRDMKLTS